MHDLTELETAADALPDHEKRELVQFLLSRLHGEEIDLNHARLPNHSLLDIEPVSVGALLQPLGRDDDLLGEMLEGQQ
ncbi:MAG: hypothetical protein ABSF26_23140 [Thermoguttaceae bacterium]|jgi:hypothetical protein